MYTLLELQIKTFGELKKIGQELNVLPEGDRRRRESWIDAIVGVNPPLLALLETSPTEDVQAQKLPIIETVEASPVPDDVQTQEPPIESKFGRIVYPRPAQKAIVQSVDTPSKAQKHRFLLYLEDERDNTLWYDGKNFVSEKWNAKFYTKRGVGPAKHQLRFHPEVRRVLLCGNVLQVVENSPRVEVELIEVQAQEPPIESKFGRIVYPRPAQKAIVQSVETSPTSEVELAQGAIEQAAKNTPGVDSVEEPKCVECFDDGFIEPI
jgi:hypothetical protein